MLYSMMTVVLNVSDVRFLLPITNRVGEIVLLADGVLCGVPYLIRIQVLDLSIH